MATYNGRGAALAAMLLTQAYGFHFIFIALATDEKIHAAVSLCGKKESEKYEAAMRELMCLFVCGWVGVRTFRSQFHPILSILGGTVSERAPFRDAIIAQAAQGLRRQMLPYIKVLLINID